MLRALPALLLFVPLAFAAPAAGTPPASRAAADFHAKIEPLLKKYCYDCHGDGLDKGGVAFDELAADDRELLANHDVWFAALKNVRASLMPPHEEDVDRPNAAEIDQLAAWIKYEAFGLDPANPDPGHVTARRLNRVEYHNTIRDLMGVEFNAESEFPPDDSGNGFDNNGDVLTISPLLLEKYLAAAETIVERAVPKVAKIVRERRASGRDFRAADDTVNGEQLSARKAATVAHTFRVERADTYQVALELEVRGSFDFDPGHCRVVGRIDGAERFSEDIVWHERTTLRHEYEETWQPGAHEISFEIVPLAPVPTPEMSDAATSPERPNKAKTRLDVRVGSVVVRGPMTPKFWATPANYARFFPKGPAPARAGARDRYAEEVLRRFATRAFRRPVEDALVARLVGFARDSYTRPGTTFEEGIGRAMMAVLASPRFLFRIEAPDPQSARAAGAAGQSYAWIDEYALASRLSYFLWSTMPDDALFELARRGELRRNLQAEVARMLRDPKALAFVRNFTGQWLQARDIEFVPINLRAVFGFDAPRVLRTRQGRADFDSATRKLMRSETEMSFDYVLREDRSVLELIDCDYAFLNGKLAAFYGVPGVTGDELHRVELPPDSPRGGVLTQGTVLAITSNPTRTSPVKRGLFVLENILGTPTPPPPPDVPALEDVRSQFKGREPKLSEMLAVHRASRLCSSCHARMDPLGLAFENFNALGVWRDTDARQPIDPSGRLVTGEAFANVRELKHILTHERRADFYRCLTEKMLIYALGRGLDYRDVETVDRIVARLDREEGRMSALLFGVIESAAFQKQRLQPAETTRVADALPAPALARNQDSQ